MKKKVLNRALSVTLSLAVAASVLTSFGVVASAEEVTLPEPVGVYDFSYGFEELAEMNDGFEVVENDAAPTLVDDEEMGQVLQLGKAVIDGQQFGNGGNLIADNSQYSTINIANPYKGREYLKEYENYEDVPTVIRRSYNQPDWKEGISISYWIKSPGAVNSNVVGFTSERYQIQADDLAKHLCTVKFNVEYNKYTDEEKAQLGIGPSGVAPGTDFYFEYVSYADGVYSTYMDQPLYVDARYMGRIYWMNKFYKPGYLQSSNGKYEPSAADGSYEKFAEYPTLGTTAPILDKNDPNYLQGDHDPGNSILRYAWTYSEMWLDASSSFYFENDNSADVQTNKNHVNSYMTTTGMQNNDCFCMNSWKSKPTFEEAMANGSAAPSPLESPDEWHQVTAVIQNDWVIYYFDGEELDTEEFYSSYGANGLATAIGGIKPWKRFNKGAGSRYGYGNDKKETYWCFYGNYVATTIMEWITLDCVNTTIGGGNRNGDGYNMYANTDEVLIKNVVFYDKVLDEDQVEFLYDNPFYYDKDNAEKDGLLGDADLDEKINATDALAILKHASKVAELEGQGLANADVTGDGSINSVDALEILKFAAGMDSNYLSK